MVLEFAINVGNVGTSLQEVDSSAQMGTVNDRKRNQKIRKR